MAYGDDIDALSPQHRWSFDNVLTDAVGSADGVLSSATLVATSNPLCEDNTYGLYTDGISDRCSIPTTADINGAVSQKVIAGWFKVSGYQNPPKRIYGEGDETQSFAIILGWGNNLLFEVDDPSFTLQIFGDTILEKSRVYHLCMMFDGSGGGNEFSAYLDGVKQLNAEPIDRQPDAATLTARSAPEFGDPAGTVAVGGTSVSLLAPINGTYAQWASWTGDLLTETEIREELFEKGVAITAISGITITDQAGLDALADSVRPNEGLCIRVTGSGTINLSADNVTFDPLASIHVQYTGTGTVNWTNTNGSNASIGSTTGGGTLNFINPASLTINGCISGCELRIYDDETGGNKSYDTELDGIESLTGTQFVYSHSGTTNTVVVQMMADGYEELIQEVTLLASDQTITLIPIAEANA